MYKSHAFSSLAAASLLMVAFLCPTAFASYAVPADNMGSGVVQTINYASNTVVVNGHTYRISSKAVYVSDSVQNIGGLQPGMRIEFIANGPLANNTSQITNVTVLPPASQ